MLWRRQFKILFVLNPKKNILLVKGAKVSFASASQSRYFLLSSLADQNFASKNARKWYGVFYFIFFFDCLGCL